MADQKDSSVDTMRHSAAHLLAAAILELYPGTRLGIGPVIDNGFYYDLDFKDPISEKDFDKIERKMEEIKAKNLPFEREELTIAEAEDLFKKHNQGFKSSLIEDLKTHGTTKVEDEQLGTPGQSIETVSIYRTGGFFDLCQGPHVNSTSEIGVFKLTKLAGAYWRGDEKNKMLTRIYGVAFPTQEELDNYLHLQEEAEKRDHRKLGKELDLFTFSPLVGSGLPLFTPKGTILREELNRFSQELREAQGFQKVWIPHITKPDLYETSGHWQKFGDELFLVKSQETNTDMVMKPMNCPHHQQIYASQLRSYRDLPIKYLETTTIYRDEKAGELLGLSRVRSVTQDDSHVFCTPEQIEEVYQMFIDIVQEFYGKIGMSFKARLSFRDPQNKQNYLGEDKLWERAQSIIETIAKNSKLDYYIAEGEAAFYGPKIDFMVTDALGREWQLATPQLDFVQPERFKITYTDTNGEAQTPVMIHFALLGSIERFLSVYIEHTAGAFPTWLAPTQVAILPVSDQHIETAEKLKEMLKPHNVRVEIDSSKETVGNKIRKSATQKIPYTIVVGEKEKELTNLNVRIRGQKDEHAFETEKFIQHLADEITNRTNAPL